MSTPGTIFIFDLDDPSYVGLLDIIQWRQTHGKWPPLPKEAAPISVPTVVVPAGELTPIRKVQVKKRLVGWVRPFPDAVNSPAIASIRTVSGIFPVLEFKPGWERIEKGWVDSSVLEYIK